MKAGRTRGAGQRRRLRAPTQSVLAERQGFSSQRNLFYYAARVLHQSCMSTKRFGPFSSLIRMQLRVRGVFAQNPSLAAIPQTNVQDLPELPLPFRRQHRRDDLDALGQIAEHPVRRSDKEFALQRIVRTSGEVEDTRVFQKAPDNGPDPNVFGAAWDARTKAAESANDQIDLFSGRGSLARSLDQLRILDLIHLGDDARRKIGSLVRDLPLDQLQP